MTTNNENEIADAIESTTSHTAASPLIDKRKSSSSAVLKFRRFLCCCCFKSQQQDSTLEDSTPVTNDQENNEYSDIRVNCDNDPKLLEVSDHNDCDANHITSDEITCIDTPQLDTIEIKEENENTDVLCSTSIHEDLLLSNKQDDDHDDIMTDVQIKADTVEYETIDSEELETNVVQYYQSDELNNDALLELMKKQAELNTYYDNFPNINDAMDEIGIDVGNAKLENSTPVTNDQENDEYSDIRANSDNDPKLLDDITCIDIPQLDTIEIKEENEANDLEELDTKVLQYDQSGELNNDNLLELTKKQAELKAYYDNFPNINDAMDETGPDVKKAKEFTKSILSNVPSGDVGDRNTACHVLNKLYGNEGQDCLFYDSKNGINLHDAFQNVADTDSQNRPFVLKLSTSEGLGNNAHKQTEQDDLKLVQTLTNVIEQKKSHPVIDDIIERLAKVHGVNKEDIVIDSVYVGTLNTVYTIKNSSGNKILSAEELKQRFEEQFPHFVSAKIHPLLYRPSFDIAFFDSRGNKKFSSESTTFEVGPPGRKKIYTTPAGWTRYGLKVLGNYSDNYWLDPFQDPRNWYRAFHGTKNAQSQDFGGGNQFSNQQYAPVDAMSNIYANGFRTARTQGYGPGVYCSPNPKFPEGGYVRSIPVDTQQGKKNFKCMLQVAVNPDGVTFHENNQIWVVADPKDIRPYGILIKEA